MNRALEGERRMLYKNGIELMYFMRGGLSRSEMLDLTPFEREVFSEFLNARLEIELAKKHSQPVY